MILNIVHCVRTDVSVLFHREYINNNKASSLTPLNLDFQL